VYQLTRVSRQKEFVCSVLVETNQSINQSINLSLFVLSLSKEKMTILMEKLKVKIRVPAA